jgi:hypothetical protein
MPLSKHAVEKRDASLRPPIVQGLQYDFCITRCSEYDPFPFKLAAKILVVVNLSVVDKHTSAIGRYHRLICTRRKIENSQPLLAERDPALMPESSIIGTAMLDGGKHGQKVPHVRGRIIVPPYSGDTTHR